MVNRCGSCDFLKRNDTKWDGDLIWCTYKGYYVNPESVACNNYTYHGHCYGRYLISATCNILVINKDLEIRLYNAFDIVRNEKTPETENMYDMINNYDIIGPTIANKLYADPFKEVIATSMLSDYILPALDEIANANYLNATNIYADMTETLYNFYFGKEKASECSMIRKRDINE